MSHNVEMVLGSRNGIHPNKTLQIHGLFTLGPQLKKNTKNQNAINHGPIDIGHQCKKRSKSIPVCHPWSVVQLGVQAGSIVTNHL